MARRTTTAAPSAAALEQAAAEAGAAATAAHAAAENRRRVEIAERGRALDAWTDAQVADRRPHQAVKRLNDAWEELIEQLGTPGCDQAGAWREFCTTHGECAAVVQAFEGAPGVTPTLASRWNPDAGSGADLVTFAGALSVAMERAATATRGPAWERADDEIETEREAAVAAAVAALPAGSRPTPVAWFLHPRRTGDSGHGWHTLTGLDITGEDYEPHDSGVLAVYSGLAARQVRAVVAVNHPVDVRYPHEITEHAAAGIVETFERGADGTLTRQDADPGQSADEAAAVGDYTRAARAAGRLHIDRGQGVAPITDRADASPDLDRYRP